MSHACCVPQTMMGALHFVLNPFVLWEAIIYFQGESDLRSACVASKVSGKYSWVCSEELREKLLSIVIPQVRGSN